MLYEAPDRHLNRKECDTALTLTHQHQLEATIDPT